MDQLKLKTIITTESLVAKRMETSITFERVDSIGCFRWFKCTGSLCLSNCWHAGKQKASCGNAENS
jgi:hypothetical protein